MMMIVITILPTVTIAAIVTDTHVQWLGQHALRSTGLALQIHQFHYLRGVIDAPVNPLLRPPKA